MSEAPNSEDPFTDLDTDAEDILGTHTYEDALFNPETTETPVNVLTGETPEHSRATLEEAKSFADRTTDEDGPQYVAKAASVETQVETQSKPYTACAFFHLSITGSLDRHKAYKAALDSTQYTVTHDANYKTGDLTITVERAT